MPIINFTEYFDIHFSRIDLLYEYYNQPLNPMIIIPLQGRIMEN